MTRPAHSKEAPAGQGQGFENHGTAFGRSPVNKNDTEAVEASQEGPRPGWREDGTVDIDAVRAGTPDLADAPAILESLCDEVEELRRRIHELATMQDRIPDTENGDWGLGWDSGYNAALADTRAIAEGGGWVVRMVDGEMGPYPTWHRAVESARGPLAPGVTRIDGPAGTVPLIGEELAKALRAGA